MTTGLKGKTKMAAFGKHLLIDLYGCNRKRLNNIKFVEEAMIRAAKSARATIVDSVFHKFSPHGISGVVVIAESHLSMHTWPEHGFASADIFTCGDQLRAHKAYLSLRKSFGAKTVTVSEMMRGVRSPR